jgi:hypothetical protein
VLPPGSQSHGARGTGEGLSQVGWEQAGWCQAEQA